MVSQALFIEKSTNIRSVHHPFLEAFIEQFRVTDMAGDYEDWSDDELLSSLLSSASCHESFRVSRRRMNQDLIHLQISAFYQTIAQQIEERTGKIPQVFFNLSPKQLSSILIICGNLLVTCEFLNKLSEFSFESLDHLIKAGEILVHNASMRIQQFF